VSRLHVKTYSSDSEGKRILADHNDYDGSFIPGDYWKRSDGTYLAMAYSWEVFPDGFTGDTLKSTKGWNLIVDNTLTAPKVIGAQMY